MTTKRKPSHPKKIRKLLNGWVLYSGLYEVCWRDDKAIRVKIEGAMFKPVGR